MSNDREEKLRQRAHALWEQEGRPHGRHDDHWRQAESEVGGTAAPKPRGRRAVTAAEGETAAPKAPRVPRRPKAVTDSAAELAAKVAGEAAPKPRRTRKASTPTP